MTSTFFPLDLQYEARIRDSFGRQGMLVTLGARLATITPGFAEIRLPYRADLTQQHGFVHGGAVATVLDSACGYAAFSLMPSDAGILTVEFKVNFLAPAQGDELVAQGKVIKPGRTITVCWGEAYTKTGGETKLVATMVATLMMIAGRADVRG